MKNTALTLILLTAAWFAVADSTSRPSEVFMQVSEHCRLKQYDEALRMAERALQTAEKTHGELSAETEYYVDLLAQVCRIAGFHDQGQSLGPEITRESLYQRSASLYRRKVAILERLYGADHPAVAYTLFELAQLYGGKAWDWRKPEAAEEALKKVLAIREKQKKAEEPQLVQTLKFLVDISEALGKKSEAEAYRDRLGIIKLGDRARKALDLEAKRRYLSALQELGGILKIPQCGLYHAHQSYENEGNIWVKRVMSRILKKMPIHPVLPEEAKRHIVKAEEYLNEGRWHSAEFEYHDAIKIAPYLPQLYYNEALIHANCGVYILAIDRMWMYLDLMACAPDEAAAKEKIRQWEILLRQQNENDKGEKP